MIRWRVANVIEGFARNSDEVRVTNFEGVGSFEVEGNFDKAIPINW
jgi:hypothetical protein